MKVVCTMVERKSKQWNGAASEWEPTAAATEPLAFTIGEVYWVSISA